MSACVKLKDSSPLESLSRNWQVKTPQSNPFSCWGVSYVSSMSAELKYHGHHRPPECNPPTQWNRMVSSFCSDVRHRGSDVESTVRWDETKCWDNEDVGSNLKHISSVHTHTVIRLYSFTPKVDGSTGPMGVVVVDRNKHDVFWEQIELGRAYHEVQQ